MQMSNLDLASGKRPELRTEHASSPLAIKRGKGRAAIAATLLLAAGIGYGLFAHAARDARTRAVDAQRQAIVPMVQTVSVSAITSARLLDLPGSVEPEETAALNC
jgi:hypothetical protein